MSKALIVIPARYGSSRFPGKPLALIKEISLIERVYRRCLLAAKSSLRSRHPVKILVATDDQRIAHEVSSFGGEAVMTRPDHPSGTDRVAEAALSPKGRGASIIINVQGDEPLLDPRIILRLAQVMRQNPSLSMATLCHPIADQREFLDPNVVKVVTDREGNALYFSRSPIPHFKNFSLSPRRSLRRSAGQPSAFSLPSRHLGIYAYRRDFLIQYVRWPQTPLEKAEKLEQLRALEHGVEIRVLRTNYRAIAVDVPGDVKKVEKAMRLR